MTLTGIEWDYKTETTIIVFELNGTTDKLEFNGIIEHKDCIKKFQAFKRICKRHEKWNK